MQAAKSMVESCSPQIATAIGDWIQQLPVEQELDPQPPRNPKLDEALAAYHAKSDRVYNPQPSSARLVAA